MKNRNKKFNWNLCLAGIIFLGLGIYFSVVRREPHFYSLFSVGMAMILMSVYDSISKEKLFLKWKCRNYLVFVFSLLFLCFVFDRIGLAFGYWMYQYSGFFDEVLKYLFEWAVPFFYFMVALKIGMEIFKKFDCRIAFVFSLIFFVTPLGLFTEWINLFSDSWIILKMPFSNLKIRDFFVVFQTLGYWSMAVISLSIR